jgi:hypothetical protein
LKLHPVMSNQDVCQVGTLLTLLDGSLAALTGAMAVYEAAQHVGLAVMQTGRTHVSRGNAETAQHI